MRERRKLKCFLRIVQMPKTGSVRRNNAHDFAADSFRAYRTRADILNRSRIHIPTQFYPTLVAFAGENSDCQTRRLLIGGRNGAAIFRVRGTSRRTHAREGEGSRFDPRMIIRRQVISGSRYTGGVMGKTVTLLSYPLWIHSIQPSFVYMPASFLRVRVCVRIARTRCAIENVSRVHGR